MIYAWARAVDTQGNHDDYFGSTQQGAWDNNVVSNLFKDGIPSFVVDRGCGEELVLAAIDSSGRPYWLVRAGWNWPGVYTSTEKNSKVLPGVSPDHGLFCHHSQCQEMPLFIYPSDHEIPASASGFRHGHCTACCPFWCVGTVGRMEQY
jgi:hypothetical protein